jgi:flavin-dependent dehydrogenase
LTSKRLDADVVVIGAGPAGATAAALLAAWGHAVVLVHGESDAPSLAESLPASTKKLLKFLGQLDTTEAASFLPNHGNTSHWAEKDAVAATTAAGYHVSRSAFDKVLREHAGSKGALMVKAHVRGIEFTSPVVVTCINEDGLRRCTGQFVLDCSGRAGVIARRGLRRTDTRYRTLAVVAEWHTEEWPSSERTHAVVDSYDRGWAWSIPISATRRQCTVMIDADLTAVRKNELERMYVDELRRAGRLTSRLAGATRVGPAWACDASTYDSVAACDRDSFLVGDAASFVEVLSSGGVKKALSSAWNAAVVVNTCLAKPAMRSSASSFFDRRERQVHAEYVRRSAAFFCDAAAVYRNDFWDVRASAADSIESDDGVSDVALSRDDDVRVTFEQLRDTQRLNLVVNPSLELADVPVIEGREVVLREGIVVPGVRTPVRFAAGLNLPELVKLAPNCLDAPSLLATYERRVAPVDPRDMLVALSFLVTRSVLSRFSRGLPNGTARFSK